MGNLVEQAVDSVAGAIDPAVAPDTNTPFAAGSVPFHQAAIWLAEIGVGAGLTSARYPMEEMMELIMIARDLGSAMTMGFIGNAGAEKMVTEMHLPPVSKELHEVCKNSMECNLQEMRRLVKEEKAKFGGSDKVEVFPIATYPTRVVVFNTNREVYEALVERNNVSGRPFFTQIKKTDMRPVRDWLETQMESLDASVECLLEGRSKDAKKKIGEMIAQFAGNDGLMRAKYKVITKQMVAENFWKKYMAENKTIVRKYLHGELSKLRETGHRAKYSELYTTPTPSAKVGVKEKLVAELKDLGGKADRILSLISEAVKGNDKALNDASFRDLGSDIQMSKFKQFSADYVEDLQGLRSAVQEALKDDSLPAMALVYDTAASRFEEYKIAGRLIERVLENIQTNVAK